MSSEIIKRPHAAPQTVSEAAEALQRNEALDLRGWARLPIEEAVQHEQNGLGLQMRDAWSLGYDNALSDQFCEKGIQDPDAMAAIILVALHQKLNGEAFVLEDCLETSRTESGNINLRLYFGSESAQEKEPEKEQPKKAHPGAREDYDHHLTVCRQLAYAVNVGLLERNWTNQRLAEEAGYEVDFIEEVLRGCPSVHVNPTLRDIARIEEAFGEELKFPVKG